MKCSWYNCGIETNKVCPAKWKKHESFHPKVLNIFFQGTEYEKDLQDFFDVCCCSKHDLELKEYLRVSGIATQAAKNRKKIKEPEYLI